MLLAARTDAPLAPQGTLQVKAIEAPRTALFCVSLSGR
jgi:hypothetical protein